jgi:hypothetical protein
MRSMTSLVLVVVACATGGTPVSPTRVGGTTELMVTLERTGCYG